MLRCLTAVGLGCALAIAVGAPTLSQERDLDAWMQAAQVGPHQPAEEDWAEIEARALEEGKVVVYAATGLIVDAAAGFEAKYPGITVEAYDLRALDLLERVRREFEAGVFNADVINVGSPDIIRQQLESQDAVVNYVPRDMEAVIPEQFRTPYLNQRLNALGWAYNGAEFEEPPFENWWELTEPEWKGRVLHDTPARSSSMLQFATAVVQNADELAAAYERHYGQPIELTEENAGYEFLKRLLANSVIGNGSTGMAEGVSASSGPFVGLVVYSLRGQAEPGGPYSFEYAYDADPALGIVWGENQLMMAHSQHPNAAKLMIRYLLDEGYMEHFSRNPSPRTDIEPQPPYRVMSDMGWWNVDLDFAIQNSSDVLDFWLAHQ